MGNLLYELLVRLMVYFQYELFAQIFISMHFLQTLLLLNFSQLVFSENQCMILKSVDVMVYFHLLTENYDSTRVNILG